jgi:hypothetical protein
MAVPFAKAYWELVFGLNGVNSLPLVQALDVGEGAVEGSAVIVTVLVGVCLGTL